jgi:iodotyrosine deiodinase
MTNPAAHQPLEFTELAPDVMAQRGQDFFKTMGLRRTVRDFSDRPVPRALIETAIRAAGTAPSGANQQPWTFVAISNRAIKAEIRAAAEIEEKAFYAGRAGQDWLDALAHLGTDWEKPFLDTAPWLIAVFAKRWGVTPSGEKIKHYYVPESVGIATGFLITALHMSGLATLTHTPSPMGFLNKVCGRHESEKAMMLMVVGYPAPDTQVPIIGKKSLEEIAIFL